MIINHNFQTLILAYRIGSFSLNIFDNWNKSIMWNEKIEKINRSIIEMSAFLLFNFLFRFVWFLFSFIRAKLKNKIAKIEKMT